MVPGTVAEVPPPQLLGIDSMYSFHVSAPPEASIAPKMFGENAVAAVLPLVMAR